MIQYGSILKGISTAAVIDCSIRVVDIILTALLEDFNFIQLNLGI